MDFSFIREFSNVSLLVAGEVGIDEYVWGDARRISPEAPVPVLEVDSVTHKLGLAANVAQNTASLGANTLLVTVRGKDSDGEKLRAMLEDAGIKENYFVEDDSRPTLRKVRVIAQKQHLVRVDYERSHSLSAKLAKEFTERICDLLPRSDGMILQDYGKGLWNADTMAFLRHAKAHKKPVFVDPNRNTPLTLYQGVSLLTPNVAEAETLCGLNNERSQVAGQDDRRLERMAQQIQTATGCEYPVITCGEWGMVYLTREGQGLRRIPTYARSVYDVTGAGDTVIAVLSVMRVLGYPIEHCIQVANAAAGIVVGQIGAATVSPQELKDELERLAKIGLIKD